MGSPPAAERLRTASCSTRACPAWWLGDTAGRGGTPGSQGTAPGTAPPRQHRRGIQPRPRTKTGGEPIGRGDLRSLWSPVSPRGTGKHRRPCAAVEAGAGGRHPESRRAGAAGACGNVRAGDGQREAGGEIKGKRKRNKIPLTFPLRSPPPPPLGLAFQLPARPSRRLAAAEDGCHACT